MKAIRYSRRSFLGGLGVLAFGHSSALARSAKSFLVIGDWGLGSANQKRVARQMGVTAQAVEASFVISTGDNFYRDGVKSIHDQQWKTSFEDIYDASSLMIPWHVTLGNHDHRGSVAAQIDYTKQSLRWHLPDTYYKHAEALSEGASAEFFLIDTEPIRRQYTSQRGRLPINQQMVWLSRELSGSTAQWKIVVGHHPVFSGGSHGGTAALQDWLVPLLERHGAQIYLSGHNHALEHIAVGRVHYLTSGAGAKPRPAGIIDGTRFVVGKRLGFLMIGLTANELRAEFKDDGGSSLYVMNVAR